MHTYVDILILIVQIIFVFEVDNIYAEIIWLCSALDALFC